MKEVKTGTRKKGELSRSKKKARRAVYLAKCKAERKNFGNVMLWRDDQKCDVFKNAERKVKTNQDIIGEHCIKNDGSALAVSDEDKKIPGKSYNERCFNRVCMRQE